MQAGCLRYKTRLSPSHKRRELLNFVPSVYFVVKEAGYFPRFNITITAPLPPSAGFA